MTSLRQLRKAALALPEVEESKRDGAVLFAASGREFASTADGVVELRMSEDEVTGTLADIPAAARLESTDTGVRVALEDINGMQLNALVRRSWAHAAPQRLSSAADDADRAGNDLAGDLPAGIGRPASRALHGAGITSLDEVARHTKDELLALHGLGPRAVAALETALAEQGRSLR